MHPAKPTPTPNLNGKTLRVYLAHMARYRWLFVAAIATIIGAVVFDLVKPQLLKVFFNDLTATPRPSEAALLGVLALYAVAEFARSGTDRLSFFIQNVAVGRVISDLLDTCFAALHSHSYAFFSNSLVGGLSRKATRYADAFESIHDELIWNLMPSAVTLFAVVVLLGFTNLGLGLAVLGWSAVYIVLNYWFVGYKVKFDRLRADKDTEVSAHLADTLTNNINLKLFGGTGPETQAFGRLTGELFKAQRKAWDLDAIARSIQGALMWVLEIGTMYLAIRLWQRGSFSVGDFVLLQGYVLQINFNLWNIGRNLHRVYEKFADAAEMTEILLRERDVTDADGAVGLRPGAGSVQLRDMTFGYDPERPVFTRFSLDIRPGERVALVGRSGSGKTTLTKLLLRFMNIQGGQIFIDGQDISQVTQESLRAQIALVPQEPSLFHRSILENIRYARPDATLAEVEAAAKAAHAHEFISKLANGYDTLVGERGVKLSGGERQRVAIARAILKDAPILILDEATSSLDSESEQLIQDALKTLMQGRTTIVIAHRLSTIMQMDTIYVLKEGKVVERGTHAELLEREGGAYRRLWDIQAGGFVE